MVKYQNTLKGVGKELDSKLKWHVDEFEYVGKKSKAYPALASSSVCHNMLILATCYDCVMILIFYFFFTTTWMFVNKTFCVVLCIFY